MKNTTLWHRDLVVAMVEDMSRGNVGNPWSDDFSWTYGRSTLKRASRVVRKVKRQVEKKARITKPRVVYDVAGIRKARDSGETFPSIAARYGLTAMKVAMIYHGRGIH